MIVGAEYRVAHATRLFLDAYRKILPLRVAGEQGFEGRCPLRRNNEMDALRRREKLLAQDAPNRGIFADGSEQFGDVETETGAAPGRGDHSTIGFAVHAALRNASTT